MKGLILAAVVVAVVTLDAARGQDDVRSSALAAWEVRAKNSRVLTGELQVETTLFPTQNARAVTDYLRKKEQLSNSYSFVIDFATGRYRVQNTKDDYNPILNRFEKVTYLNIFDGTCLKSACLPPAEGGTRVGKAGGYFADATVVRSNLSDYPLDLMLAPFILYEGRFPKPGDLGFYPASFHLHTLAESDDILVPDRSPLPKMPNQTRWKVGPTKVGKAISVIDICFDKLNQYHTASYSIRISDRVISDININYERGRPSSFSVTQNLIHKNGVYSTNDVRVTKLQYLDFAGANDFTYEPAPGMVVGEVTGRSADAPRTKAGRTQIERSKVLDDGSLEKFPKQDSEVSSNSWFFWLTAGLCVIVASYVTVRRFRAAARRANNTL